MGSIYLDPSVRSVRGTSHGKITSLATDFNKNGKPFGIVVIPKANITGAVISNPDNAGLIVSMKLVEDESASNYPVMFNWETSGIIETLPAGAIDTDIYDVYWFSSF